jgi:hypothetical protein
MAMKFIIISVIAMVIIPWLLGTLMSKGVSRRDKRDEDECDKDDSVFGCQ